MSDKMKLPRPQETCERGGLQGCGDPTCPICMPSDPRGAGGGLFGRPSSGEVTFTISSSNERRSEAFREMQERMFRRIYTDFSWASEPAKEERGDPKVRAAQDEEKRLREKVERFFVKTAHSLSWDDVIGNEGAREALVEAIEHPVKFKEIYAHYRKRPTKGVLLYGPPGCGKTMFGKAAASVLADLRGKAGAEHTMMHIKGPEIQSPYVGVTEEIVRDVFAYARAYQALHGYPMVVFIDEADAILPSRDGNGSRRALPWEESNVATFLTEMDGIDESGAFVIIATNRPHAIDAAILRDGRIDRKIKVERPSQQAVVSILTKALAGVPLSAAHTIGEIAEFATSCFFAPHRHILKLTSERGQDWLTLGHIVNGAMIVGMVEQAKAAAFRRDIAAGGKPSGIVAADFEAAIASIQKQNTGLDHTLAVTEYCERIGVDAVRIDQIKHHRPAIEIDGDMKAVH